MVDLMGQYSKIKNEIDSNIISSIESGKFVNGPIVKQFSENLSSYLNIRNVIPCANGTDALQIALMAIEVGPGDEVIMADTNWIATAAPIVHLGATPVFVDILTDSWCLDPEQVEAAITSKTKAIVAVHLYGNLCEMDALQAIGDRYGIPVIEDAAEAVGSVYHGNRAGSMGCFGAFSFHGTKTITTGEGGMFVTNDPDLYEQVLTLSNHGRSRLQTKQFWPDMVGYKFKMSNIQAAIGCAQMQRIDDLISEKREIFLMYQAALKNLPIHMNPEPDGCSNGYWMPTFVVQDEISFDRNALISDLKTNGIDARVFFWPLSSTSCPGIKTQSQSRYSDIINLRALNLPSFFGMSKQDILRVCHFVSLALNSQP